MGGPVIGVVPGHAPSVRTPSRHVDAVQKNPGFGVGVFVQDPPDGISDEQSPKPAAFKSRVDASQVKQALLVPPQPPPQPQHASFADTPSELKNESPWAEHHPFDS